MHPRSKRATNENPRPHRACYIFVAQGITLAMNGVGADTGQQLTYQSRPSYRHKASVNTMREIIKGVLESELQGCTYHMDQATVQTKRICDEIKNGLKEMNLPRYKYVVQVVIGEQRGEGVRMGSRCFWDSETDNVASETYVNVRVVWPPTY
ncbi:unnamed protein product [Ectocarpus fasciculatus]